MSESTEGLAEALVRAELQSAAAKLTVVDGLDAIMDKLSAPRDTPDSAA